ncbi:uncharacterized protein K02A2.6-like [Actinia tenebrosa]|uniref:Uncharacterized protein K02A2.6-like n=1 Tax=Actinia tenebrosa TaxID=6105 RepID=A0A6P8J415_ACTTE|nr:uncharacterized protein K02A2.6-like [Actinia tenebrosa]
MKGNRVIIPTGMRPGILDRLHDAHQGLTSTLQRARRTVYWPKLQDVITEMIQKCDECPRYGDKKTRPSERQITATRPMEILGMDLLDFQGQHALVTVAYFSGFLTCGILNNETTDAVIKVLNNIFRNFRHFCEQLDIGHITSSQHYHQSNGRAERAVATVKQMLKKSANEIDITKALTTYLDTPLSDTLPSPAELFHNRRINTSLSRTIPPIWFIDGNSDEWKPGYIESKDSIQTHTGSSMTRQRPQTSIPLQFSGNLSDVTPIELMPTSATPDHEMPESVLPSTDTPNTLAAPTPTKQGKTATPWKPKTFGGEGTRLKITDSTPVLTKLCSGHEIKPHRDPEFVYGFVKHCTIVTSLRSLKSLRHVSIQYISILVLETSSRGDLLPVPTHGLRGF